MAAKEGESIITCVVYPAQQGLSFNYDASSGGIGIQTHLS